MIEIKLTNPDTLHSPVGPYLIAAVLAQSRISR